MPKADFIETEGTITRMRGHGFYTVALANGHEVLARMSGRMSKNHIRVIQDDRVLLDLRTVEADRDATIVAALASLVDDQPRVDEEKSRPAVRDDSA